MLKHIARWPVGIYRDASQKHPYIHSLANPNQVEGKAFPILVDFLSIMLLARIVSDHDQGSLQILFRPTSLLMVCPYRSKQKEKASPTQVLGYQ